MNHIVSYSSNVFSAPEREMDFCDVITYIKINPKLKNDTVRLRAIVDPDEFKKEKSAALPVVSISGTFKSSFKKEDLQQHSGLMQIDIDHIDNVDEEIFKIKQDQYVLAAWRSVSGKGLKVIFRIPDDPVKHDQCFVSLQKYLSDTYQLKCDSACRNINRLLFLSYDPDIFYNPDAMIFEPKNSIVKKMINGKTSRNIPKNVSETFQNVEETLRTLETKHIDVTQSYSEQWLKIGFAFSHEFGEEGRNFFHRISKFHPGYSAEKCDKQYNACLNSDGEGISIGTFFHIVNEELEKNKPELSEPQTKEVSAKTIFDITEEYLTSKYKFRYNQISNQVEYSDIPKNEYKVVNENNLYIELRKKHIKITLSNLKALLASDFAISFNPFNEYFDNLPSWNSNEKDYISELSNYVNTKDQMRFNTQFKKMMIRSVACTLSSKIINKQCFILVHDKQNSGKTTFCRFLCPPKLSEYYTENLGDDKDSKISLCENFIINLDELSTLHRQEINALKSILSKQFDKSRRPFDTRQIVRPRTANFIGSTNKTEFLTDETGSVRWLCFEIENIDWEYSTKVDVNLVWSQAYSLYKSGYDYELSVEEIKQNDEINKVHHVISPEHELILKYYCPGSKEDNDKFYTATDIMTELNKHLSGSYKLNPVTIGKALKFLNFPKGEKNNGNYTVKGYYLKHNMSNYE